MHVEYVIALKRGSQLKTLGKRYSELHDFHDLLLEHGLVDKLKAPPFPEKQTFRDSWCRRRAEQTKPVWADSRPYEHPHGLSTRHPRRRRDAPPRNF